MSAYQPFFVACADNLLEQVKELHCSVQAERRAFGFYMAASYGHLEIVQFLEDKIEVVGQTPEEYAFQAACHKEGKTVLDYLLYERKMFISDELLYWLNDNELHSVMKAIRSRHLEN